jgi:hypothetical protein
MVYVGVDLHRKSSHVAVLTGDGELLASRRVASRPDEFLRVFGELEAQPPVGVAFEATYGWGWFADLMHNVGIPAHIAHPLCHQGHLLDQGQERSRRCEDARAPAPYEPAA